MNIEIKEVTTKRDLKRFVDFPFTLYKDNPYWVPPLKKGELETLDPDKNPAFEHCRARILLAFAEGKLAGRVVGIINPRCVEKWKRKDARFCWFDVIDNIEVSKALFRDLSQWAASEGMERLVGPMGFTTFERQGMLVDGFEENPTFSGCYNFPYYPAHLRSIGFEQEVNFVEYEMRVPEEVPDKIVRISEVIRERYGLEVIKAKSARELLPYGEDVFRVINQAYSPLYGFTELTDSQISYFVRKYFGVINPEYVTAVIDREGKMLGFQISVPSLSQALRKARGRIFPFGWWHIRKAYKNPDRIDALLTGVVPEYQSKGINSLIMVHLTEAAIRNGIRYCESNGELEENFKIQNTWRYFEGRQHRRASLFALRVS